MAVPLPLFPASTIVGGGGKGGPSHDKGDGTGGPYHDKGGGKGGTSHDKGGGGKGGPSHDKGGGKGGPYHGKGGGTGGPSHWKGGDGKGGDGNGVESCPAHLLPAVRRNRFYMTVGLESPAMSHQQYDVQQSNKPTASGRAERHQGTGPLVGAGSLAVLGIRAGCWLFDLLYVVPLTCHRWTFWRWLRVATCLVRILSSF